MFLPVAFGFQRGFRNLKANWRNIFCSSHSNGRQGVRACYFDCKRRNYFAATGMGSASLQHVHVGIDAAVAATSVARRTSLVAANLNLLWLLILRPLVDLCARREQRCDFRVVEGLRQTITTATIPHLLYDAHFFCGYVECCFPGTFNTRLLI